MKKVFMLTCLIFLPACNWVSNQITGSGNVIIEERQIDSFDELKAAGVFNVQLLHDEKEYLTIEADDNLQSYIKTEVQNGELTIYVDAQIKPTKPIMIALHYKNITEIDATGVVGLRAKHLASKKLDIALSESSRITAHIETDRLEIEGYGASKFDLSGTAKRQKMDLSGSSAYHAGDLSSQYAEIVASGSVHVTLQVHKKVSGELAGAALVRYKGKPEVAMKITGAASIQKVD